jgi:trimeric autotransporter adhesin
MTNPTSNFGWQMPTSTDLVTDLPADFEVFGQAVDTSLADLKGGTTGQVLSKASNTNMDFTWVTTDDANAIQNSIVDAKGDLVAASANDTPARLAVGANGTSLVADSTTATGLAYASRATLAANTFTADQTVNTVRVGLGNSGVSTNTVVGNTALNANTTGSQNTAIGYVALFANTTGSENNAIGRNAMATNTTGGANNALGMYSLGLNESGGQNVAVGHYALYANTTGSLNNAMGSNAMAANTTGTGNTGIGNEALRLVSTGSNNTSVGRSSLYNVTAGNNTGVGFEAGAGLTSGSNNSFLGNGSTPSSATVSNTITLGNSSIATLRCQVTSITSLSDERDKKDIAPLEHGLDFVKQLKPVSFEWNTRPETRTDTEGNEIEIQGKVGIADIGFIAQDIVALEDSLGAADSLQLSYRDNPEKLEVTQGRLIPILVKAIQDLTAKVEALEAAQA